MVGFGSRENPKGRYLAFRMSHDHYWRDKKCQVVVATSPEIIEKEVCREKDIKLSNRFFGEEKWPLKIFDVRDPLEILLTFNRELIKSNFYRKRLDEARSSSDTIGAWEPNIYARQNGKEITRAFLAFPPTTQEYIAGAVWGHFLKDTTK